MWQKARIITSDPYIDTDVLKNYNDKLYVWRKPQKVSGGTVAFTGEPNELTLQAYPTNLIVNLAQLWIVKNVLELEASFKEEVPYVNVDTTLYTPTM